MPSFLAFFAICRARSWLASSPPVSCSPGLQPLGLLRGAWDVPGARPAGCRRLRAASLPQDRAGRLLAGVRDRLPSASRRTWPLSLPAFRRRRQRSRFLRRTLGACTALGDSRPGAQGRRACSGAPRPSSGTCPSGWPRPCAAWPRAVRAGLLQGGAAGSDPAGSPGLAGRARPQPSPAQPSAGAPSSCLDAGLAGASASPRFALPARPVRALTGPACLHGTGLGAGVMGCCGHAGGTVCPLGRSPAGLAPGAPGGCA